jgi:phosphate transport system permease protein
VTAPARPRLPWWTVGLSGAGAVAAVGGLALVLGFVAVGLHAGPVDWGTLLTSKVWYPQGPLFGVTAMLFGTAVVSGIALLLAVPLGRAAAVALSEQVPPRWARPLRTGVELLAAIPSIVYGLVGIALVRPFVAYVGDVPGGDSLLAAGLVLAVMVLPTIVAGSVDALRAVPQDVREAARALGLTRSEVLRSAVLPLARPGLRAAVLLGLARALGETIAVFLVIGRADGRLPSPGHLLDALFHPGQTLTTKLGGPEPVLAAAVGPHRAALCAVALLLLGTVAVATVLGASGRGAPHPPRHRVARTARELRCTVARSGRLAAVVLPVLLLVGVVSLLVTRGSVALSPGFWVHAAQGASGGGVRDQVVGTLVLVAATGALSLPLGLGLGLVLGEWAPPRLVRPLRTATLTLGGVPTILLGLAGYVVFSTALGWGKSWLAGAIVLCAVVVPVIALSVAARLDQLPPADREAALALGLTRVQLVRSVLLPFALPALVTGALLGLARAAGETAPLLFTATVFSGATLFPHGVVQAPVAALPTHVFALAQDAADQQSVDAAWGAALVLVLVAGALLLLAVPARRRLERS